MLVDSKILHVLQNLSSIFNIKKQTKKLMDLVYQLKVCLFSTTN